MDEIIEFTKHLQNVYSGICLMGTPHKGDNRLMGTNWYSPKRMYSFIWDKPSVIRDKNKSV